MLPEKVPKRNLLEYAERIGGKRMSLSFLRALRSAGVENNPELNKKQLKNVFSKLYQDESFTKHFRLEREKLEKLINQRDRRRRAYIKMAIESDIEEEEAKLIAQGEQVISPWRGKRFDYRKNRPERSIGFQQKAREEAVSSVNRIQQSKLKEMRRSSALSPKRTSQKGGPVTSILRLQGKKK